MSILFFSSKRLDEPIAWTPGPIVMNTQEELNTAYQEIKDAFSLDAVLKKKPLQITSVLGFKIVLPEIVNEKNPFVFLQKDNEQFIIKMGDSTTGNAKRIVMTLKQFDKVVLGGKYRLDGAGRLCYDDITSFVGLFFCAHF